MDAEIAHRGLAGGPDLFKQKPRKQNTWRVMADLMLQCEGILPTAKAERAAARARYRSSRLARAGGDTLQMELLPYPHPKKSDWLYAPYGRFPTRHDYETAMLLSRPPLLTEALAMHPRTAIICYQQYHWPDYKMLFPGAVSNLVHHNQNYESAMWHGAKVTLAYHFTRFFNEDHRLDELFAVALTLPGYR